MKKRTVFSSKMFKQIVLPKYTPSELINIAETFMSGDVEVISDSNNVQFEELVLVDSYEEWLQVKATSVPEWVSSSMSFITDFKNEIEKHFSKTCRTLTTAHTIDALCSLGELLIDMERKISYQTFLELENIFRLLNAEKPEDSEDTWSSIILVFNGTLEITRRVKPIRNCDIFYQAFEQNINFIDSILTFSYKLWLKLEDYFRLTPDNTYDPQSCSTNFFELNQNLHEIKFNFHVINSFWQPRREVIFHAYRKIPSLKSIMTKSYEGEDDVCPICLDFKLTPDSDFTILLDCNHLVCDPCWDTQSRKFENNRCPMCRKDVCKIGKSPEFRRYKVAMSEYKVNLLPRPYNESGSIASTGVNREQPATPSEGFGGEPAAFDN